MQMMPGMSTKTGAGADAGSAKALTEATPASVLGAVSNAPCVPAVQLTSAALRGPFSCERRLATAATASKPVTPSDGCAAS